MRRGLLTWYLQRAVLVLGFFFVYVLHINLVVVSRSADTTAHEGTLPDFPKTNGLREPSFLDAVSNDDSTIQRKSPCQDMGNHNATTTSKPVWVAGYPGSGNDLLRTLVQRMTGFEGRDIYKDVHCAVGRTATCKTHWPVYRRHPPLDLLDDFHETAVLLIRNPAKALPSLYNYEWEYTNHIQDHSKQAPEDAWVDWRDANFGRQIRIWKRVVTWWLEHWDVRTLVPYERLIHESTGPALLRQLATQLEAANFPVATDWQCQWQWCVQQAATVKRSGHKYTPPFQPHQKQAMLKVVNQTLTQFSNHTVLSDILKFYLLDIEQNTRVVVANDRPRQQRAKGA
jgi:hypothetical protein